MPKDTWNGQPAWEEGRYLTLLIDPIGPDGQPEDLLQSFHKVADVGVSAISIGTAALMAAAAQMPDDIIVSISLFLAGIHLISREVDKNLFQRSSLKKSGFSETDIEVKCIDKCPSQEARRLSEIFRPYARKEASASKTRFFLTAAIPLFLLPFSQIAAMGAALALAPSFTRSAIAAFSFENVANGEWAIVNKPTSIPLEEADKKIKQNGPFQLSYFLGLPPAKAP